MNHETQAAEGRDYLNLTGDMLIVCAWCGRKLGTKAGGDDTTHTICEKCEKEIDYDA